MRARYRTPGSITREREREGQTTTTAAAAGAHHAGVLIARGGRARVAAQSAGSSSGAACVAKAASWRERWGFGAASHVEIGGGRRVEIV